MSGTVIWLDSEKALIFALKPTGVEKTSFEKIKIEHHTENKKDRKHDGAADRYFHDLAIKIEGEGNLLILGPGEAKNLFKSHLESHHPKVSKRVVGVEASDHPTDNQILAAAGKFFKKYDLFNSPIRE
jgi:stalled ribosome rescue protein Dom34